MAPEDQPEDDHDHSADEEDDDEDEHDFGGHAGETDDPSRDMDSGHPPSGSPAVKGGGGESSVKLLVDSNPRKTWRACDLCRKRKQRCNGFEMPDQRCTVCINSGITCTYVEDSKKRAPPKGYVESLEARCKKAEDLLVQLVPGFDVVKSLGPPLVKETFSRTNKKGPVPKSEKAKELKIKAEQGMGMGVGTFNSPEAALPSPAREQPTGGVVRSSSNLSDHVGRTSSIPLLTNQPLVGSSTSSSPMYPPSSRAPGQPGFGQPGRPGLAPPFEPYPRNGSQALPVTAPAHARYDATYNQPGGSSTVGPTVDNGAATREREEEEASLIGFVQLAHRDEQLFKRFMGLSSGLPLMYSALGFKYGSSPNKFHLELKAHRTTSRSRFWRIPPWESTPTAFSSTADPSAPSSITQTPGGRPPCPQLAAMRDQNPFASWPEHDLAWMLVNAYFERVNDIVPLLHRPTFESRYNSQAYNSDPGFARVCLLVFAVASSYVDDERVLFPKDDGTTYGVDSAGWIYWHGFGRMVRHRLAPTELCDLQVAVLLVQFLRNSSQPGSCWIIIGEGLRFAQDVAVHRRRAKRSSDPVENEQFRRAFWCLYALEREWSGFLGRPFLLAEEDFDVELPYECDDEYWQTGSQATDFVQPLNRRPSQLTAFILTLQLHKIFSTILREIYNTKRTRGRSPAEVVETLSQELQEWLNVLPPHLQWDPNQPENLWFRQAVDLHLQYNVVLTYLHRPFLPSPRKPNTLSPGSFTACIGAAHAIASIIHCHWIRMHEVYHSVFNTAYTAALVLLVGYWSTRGNEAQAALSSIMKLEGAMEASERVFFGIGRARDAVTVLSAPRVEVPTVGNSKRKLSGEGAHNGPDGQPWESRRPPPPPPHGQRPLSRTMPPIQGQASAIPPGARFAPPPPPGAYPQYPHHQASPSTAEWGTAALVSPRTPAFANSPSTSQGGASEGDSLQLGLFPDFYQGFSDPDMTLFPGGSGDDYWQGQVLPDQPLPAGYSAGYPLDGGVYATSPSQQDPRFPPPPVAESVYPHAHFQQPGGRPSYPHVPHHVTGHHSQQQQQQHPYPQ